MKKFILKHKVLTVIILLLLAFTSWTIYSNLTIGITNYNVSLDKIPNNFNGFKIAHVSDYHNAHFALNNDYLVSMIEKEKPDIIALTGDIVDSHHTDVDVSIALVEKLVNVAPCYYITGNHEAWLGEVYDKLEERMIELGVIVLRNETVQIKKGGEHINIIGIDDPDFGPPSTYIDDKTKISDSISMALMNNYVEGYNILLSHRPEVFDSYVENDMDLVLVGHAHGGQVRLPFVGGVVAPDQGFFPKYDAGRFDEDNTTMIISRGIGNSIIPVRVNNQPELVMIELNTNS